jgi:alkylation response protein AidB-like acyl-CoA dehydrogenase
MRLQHTAADQAFRAEVRTFVAAELPQTVRDKVRLGRHLQRADYVDWYGRLHARGWVAPHWPVEHGGTGWTPLQRLLFDEEILLGGAPRMIASGIMMLGPMLIRYGSEEQKARLLPPILRSQTWWAQGFSEPGAGSDLASLRTKAVRDGSDFIVSGHKVWTSYAQFCDMLFCLVRTDFDCKPQEGITFVLIDLKSPGVTVRPVRTLDGGADLNEVHLDNVRVPGENLVGEVNQGWTYAKNLLGHERSGIAGVGACKQQLARLKGLAAQVRADGGPLLQDRDFAARVHRLEIELLALEATSLRLLSTPAHGAWATAQTPMLKVRGTELRQSIYRLMLEVAGPEGMCWGEPSDDADDLDAQLRGLAPNYLDARKFSIYGGTNEVQRNLIARALLAD